MKERRSFCKLAVVVLAAAVLLGCAVKPRYTDQAAEAATPDTTATGFNPLGLAQDTVIVTSSNTAAEKKLLHELRASQQGQPQTAADSESLPDSLNHQVYRVQLLTVDNYSDARRALAVAEEIFDLPVSLTYDQPYYKLRVGEFETKSDADGYLAKAKTAGYANAWVLLTNVGVNELRPLYESTAPPAPPDTTSGSNDKHD
ncbi:hypothetical protein C3F09_03245 [candidate division GN15 bacterium]|uniref:SPOR domain-containing protein n=1 Tax=candidate division GN15 bacterium TaxID=2072418 RepID=A0A855XA36_9BACT|nr:MAG: hypothetical protein C3F09_03245 [candidate division GN15 bacterium]